MPTDRIRSVEELVEHLVDNVGCATQLRPWEGELPHVDDWKRILLPLLRAHDREIIEACCRAVLRAQRLICDCEMGDCPRVISVQKAIRTALAHLLSEAQEEKT